MSTIEAMVQVSGYHNLQQIYVGTRTLVYRGVSCDDQKPVVLKLMRNDYPSFNELVQFRNQFTIAKNLDFPGIVKPLSLENYRNGYALVMEDFGGISLKDYATNVERLHTASLQQFLHIAIQIVTTLDGLMRQCVIHKDLKPANILINPTTKEVKLIDFSIASLLPRETQQLQNPNVLEGTLAYISPEQTGRMNRGIDYRTDFYSLGITFFELLAGRLPFGSNDPIELVHCHIAKQPPKIHTFNPLIPSILSDIIAKLMAKNAEDRYQSAKGLKHDLEVCKQQWQETGNIAPFKLGTRDISERFLIPEKLYGRQAEVKALLDAFDRVSSEGVEGDEEGNFSNNPKGNPSSPLPTKMEMMLIAGFSGIGKTAVVNEVHKPIVEARGYFIKGKYDQFQRNIPFSAFVQALQNLMGQVLGENETQLFDWKTKILQTLGENGQVIIDVIPKLEQIIGKQPPVPELSGSAATNRFNLLFQKFIKVFATQEHLLVIFIDDLQWVDLASLRLIQLLMSETDTSYLLIIGAYRDNEVFPAHPLRLTLEEIQKSGAIVNTITLNPLNKSDLNHLIADTLDCSLGIALPLTELVHQRTKGNPFFTNQFIKSIYEDGLISFNFEQGCWQCDIAHLKQLALTDDVVEFMAVQLKKLPKSTQNVLRLAACIGNEFDLATLAIVDEKSQIETAKDLWKSLQEGLILPTSEFYIFYQNENGSLPLLDGSPLTRGSESSTNYRFLHDRVQQAAYSLIPENRKKATHLKIGRLLLTNKKADGWKEKVFDIVNQFNMGVELITERIEKDELAQLNLTAGRKAKASTAYAAAVGYLTVGMELLAADNWESQYDLTLALYLEAIEAEYLNARFEQSASLAEIALRNCKTLLERIVVYQLKIQFFTAQNQMSLALSTGLEALDLMGFPLTSTPTKDAVISLPKLDDVATLPVMTVPLQLAAMRVLMTVIPAAFMVSPTTHPQVILTMVNLCHEHGYSAFAASAYSQYGLVLSGVMGDIEAGYHSGQVALKLLELFHASELKCKVYLLVYGFISPWKEKLRSCLVPLLEGLQSGLETGDVEFAGYCTFHYCDKAFGSGEVLDAIAYKQASFIELMLKFKQEFSLYYDKVWHQLILNLQGLAADKCQLLGDSFDELELLPYFHSTNNGTLLFATYVAKLILSYLFGNYATAIESAQSADEFAASGAGMMTSAYHNFYYPLALLALYPHADSQRRTEYMTLVEAQLTTMQNWADYAPINFLHKYYLVEAERHRVLGQKVEAIECYDRAIALAKENEYLNEEALAHELAAKFYLEWGKEKIAAVYLTDAYYAYARWGAKAKVDDLEQRYPQLLVPILKREENAVNVSETLTKVSVETLHPTRTGKSSVLDLAAVIKASQVVSGQILLDQLLSTLIQVVLENAGASGCALIFPKAGSWVIEATGSTSCTPAKVLQSLPLESSSQVPVSLINYVARTAETLLIHDITVAASTNQLSLLQNDPYIRREQPQSLMCTPILNQGNLIGILYLENNLTTGAFTSDRVELLNLLCSQAAISLENARLFQQAQDYAQQLELSLNNLQQMHLQLVQSEKMSALGNLVAGVAHEINNPVGFISGNLQPAQDFVQDLFHLIDLYQQHYPNPVADIQAEIEAIDLEYVRDDLPKLLHSMKEGVARILNISNSLRTFSRKDTDSKVPFNIHDGIDSTILILKHRLRANETRPAIEVVKNYGNLPYVNCFPGQLNQVFMNLLANAIDALEESNPGRSFEEIQAHPNRITIWTQVGSGQEFSLTPFVVIRIKDNGMGISAPVKQHIFDHLFTTKSVGKGTGLGLAIARQIVVEKHGGALEVNSALGQGAEFVISIPL